MLKFMFESLWFVIPSYIANIVPAFVKNINFLNFPVDFNKTWNGKRIFGDHKTFRGLFFGILGASIVSVLQGHGWYLGFILGTGTLTGDLIGSFFKRRLSIQPGGKNLLVDELPGSFFGLLFAFIFGVLTINLYKALFLLIIGIPLHVIANILWFKLKLKEVPW